ncbi:2,4-dihydroxyhept-2-ene-1,7-dioic acid aldolase [Alcaligenes pakistanensis]|uniref:2,4-dihydroxyhept-2-ene-1,7-dioic acid aldolase n=1 Tax=Alcaligenes pakistanensis TaxID=1482717 RepID=A0A8H9IIX5_9BURK|nr:4-hydroxy-2-oxoheptanedioate aldolase [Alcaligenes pakistanensis]GHC53361.1 2,4-dihydroxyhept-2-ene-1,7-dioic acid aldolase [Alcaligenes pakistanensis]
MHNSFKQALSKNDPVIGLWLGLANAYTAELLGGSGYDWLVIDNEHAPNTVPSTLAQLQALASTPAHAVVRAASDDTVEIKRLLDLGAQTLLIPMVESAEQATRIVSATRYPPLGVRGVGAALARASRWQQVPDYLAHADTQICTLVQVESTAGLLALPEIARVSGVDGVFIGPADLAASMGYLGNPGHPHVQQAIATAISEIRKAGKAAGILTGDMAMARTYLQLGAVFVAVGSDVGILSNGARALRESFRDIG